MTPAPGEAGPGDRTAPAAEEARPGTPNGAAPPPSEAPDESASELAERLFAQGSALGSRLLRLARIRADQARLQVVRARARLVLGMLAGALALGLGIAGVVFVARGLAGGLTQLFRGRAWLGELTAGLVLVLVPFVALGIARLRSERARIEHYRKKYADDDDAPEDPRTDPAPDTPAAHGGGAPGGAPRADADASGARPAHDRD